MACTCGWHTRPVSRVERQRGKRMRSVPGMFFAMLLAIVGAGYSAQGGAADPEYPARSVRLLVPFPPGGSNDIMARYFAQYLTERLGQQVVVDNRGGAEGIIATDIVAHARPDGYTLLFVSAAHSVHGGTRKKLPRSEEHTSELQSLRQ